MLKRITKREAFRLFVARKPFLMCPCKMRPEGPFSMAWTCHSGEYLERAEMYREHATLWKGDEARTAWALAYNNWAFYNATYETGYYAHYYVES